MKIYKYIWSVFIVVFTIVFADYYSESKNTYSCVSVGGTLACSYSFASGCGIPIVMLKVMII